MNFLFRSTGEQLIVRKISFKLNIDGSGQADISTGIAFLDHMLQLFSRHGFFDLSIEAKGDIDVDYHHLVEDMGISMGQAVKEALSDKAGIRRYGSVSYTHLTLPTTKNV